MTDNKIRPGIADDVGTRDGNGFIAARCEQQRGIERRVAVAGEDGDLIAARQHGQEIDGEITVEHLSGDADSSAVRGRKAARDGSRPRVRDRESAEPITASDDEAVRTLHGDILKRVAVKAFAGEPECSGDGQIGRHDAGPETVAVIESDGQLPVGSEHNGIQRAIGIDEADRDIERLRPGRKRFIER